MLVAAASSRGPVCRPRAGKPVSLRYAPRVLLRSSARRPAAIKCGQYQNAGCTLGPTSTHLKAPNAGCMCFLESRLGFADAPHFDKPLCSLPQRLRATSRQTVRGTYSAEGERQWVGTCCSRSDICSTVVSPSSRCRRAAWSVVADLSTELGVEGPGRHAPPGASEKRSSGCSGDFASLGE